MTYLGSTAHGVHIWAPRISRKIIQRFTLREILVTVAHQLMFTRSVPRGLLSPAAQHDGDSSSFNPIIIVVVVAILIAAGVGGFFVIRMRKHSKAYAAVANNTAYTASQQTMPQNFVGQQAQAQPQQAPASSDAPRFCSSCGSPLTPDSQFCPHCGAPVKH